jgi:hypothetical protein
MRALAEFIMRGRMQASLVALLGNLIPLVSPATVGLVTLRRSYQESLLVLLWAAMPLLASLFFSNASPLIVLTSLITLLGVVVSAQVLRGTMSWQLTLLAALVFSSLLMLVTGTLLAEETRQIAVEVESLMANLTSVADNPVSPFYVLMAGVAQNLAIEKMSEGFVIGFFAWLMVIHIIGSLLLSRWWQSLLFNPGGFREEFHNLRFNPVLASVLLLVVALFYLLPTTYVPWASMLGIPLLLAGLSLVHHTLSALGLGSLWLIIVYVGLLLLGPLSLVLIGVGYLDSFLNFRIRLARFRKS